ncbi:hypothetical protein BDY19DRAFT_982954 [Irpex rosettiformis]|uniref:Uncharacterized protein n=1 Tax=Irpex rosettiformis TaxID=378272 RepID=A0ACB8UGJ2_9APHY|nr:hypothetical protein BDY19DRAFT_982954 [Irpex rosettiformis]
MSTKVIVVGAGIAGPVLATFLKLRGYEPTVYERVPELPDGGLGHLLQPNGLRVLSKVPGLLENIEMAKLERTAFYSVVQGDTGLLAEQPTNPTFAFHGVRRPVFHKALVEAAERVGVEFKWGHKLVSLEQGEDSVTVAFENGSKATGSFVVGCDGLHSNTRTCLFGDEKADFTGLCQTGGICPIPENMNFPFTFLNIFGDGVHIVAYVINDRQASWAMTKREPEAKETWRAQDDSVKQAVQNSEVAKWDFGGSELIKNSEHIVKYGLYDRPELTTWHQGRVVLIGDAAHPTSPHLGQGANQSFEDIDLLTELLDKYNPSTASPSTSTLEALFTEFETARIPRSSAMVKGARALGESRVVQGVDACIERNNKVRIQWSDADAVARAREAMFKSVSAKET